jgi:hypothetical protein
MQLKLSNNTITGTLAGKLIQCAVRMSQGTGSPARGEYVIPPPASDAIYGQTALVIPLKQGSPGFAGMPAYLKAGIAQSALKLGFAPADKVYTAPSGWAQTGLKMGYAPAMKWAAPLVGSAPASKVAAPLVGSAPASKVAAPLVGSAPASKVAAPLVGSAPALKVKVGAPRPGLASSAGGGAAESAGGAGAERQALAKEVLVLSDKPIAGRNCLVVSIGFADLMLGLAATGGATLTVL